MLVLFFISTLWKPCYCHCVLQHTYRKLNIFNVYVGYSFLSMTVTMLAYDKLDCPQPCPMEDLVFLQKERKKEREIKTKNSHLHDDGKTVNVTFDRSEISFNNSPPL